MSPLRPFKTERLANWAGFVFLLQFARVRYIAAQAIVERKPEHLAARESLIKMLDDDELCQHAMTGLWYVGQHGAKAIPKLEAIIKKDNPHLRIRASVTLWIVHPESKLAPAVMREMLQHKDYEVRGSAAALVGKVGRRAGTGPTARHAS